MLVLGCSQKKEVVLSECQKNNTGNLLIKSIKDYDRYLYINDKKIGILYSKSNYYIDNLNAEIVDIMSIQIQDTIQFVSEIETTKVKVSQCDTIELFF